MLCGGFERDSKLNDCSQKSALVRALRVCACMCLRAGAHGPYRETKRSGCRWSTAPVRSVLELQPCFIYPENDAHWCDADLNVTTETTTSERSSWCVRSAILRLGEGRRNQTKRTSLDSTNTMVGTQWIKNICSLFNGGCRLLLRVFWSLFGY